MTEVTDKNYTINHSNISHPQKTAQQEAVTRSRGRTRRSRAGCRRGWRPSPSQALLALLREAPQPRPSAARTWLFTWIIPISSVLPAPLLAFFSDNTVAKDAKLLKTEMLE